MHRLKKQLSLFLFIMLLCTLFGHKTYANYLAYTDTIKAADKWPVMMNLLNRIRGEYSVSFQGYTLNASQVQLTLLGNMASDYSKNVSNHFGTSLSVSYGFYISKHWHLVYGINSRFGKKVLNKNNQIALGYNGILKGANRNYYVEPYIAYYFGKNGYGLGDYTGPSGIGFGNVPLIPNGSKLFVGQKQQGIALGLGLRADVNSYLSLMIGAAHYFSVNSKHGVFNANKHFFYTRTGFQEFNDEIIYQEDGEIKQQSTFILDPWQIKVGFMFAL